MEYDPMAELGFVSESQFITSCNGVLSRNDYVRDLCNRAIRDGARLYDAISRYESLCTYVLSREEDKKMSTPKMLLPFLKAYGVSDHLAYSFAKEDLNIMPGAKEAMCYLNELMPTFITTGTFEHHMMALTEELGYPIDNVSCTKVELDTVETDRSEAKRLREIATRIASLRVPTTMYTVTEAKYLDNEDAILLTELDKIFLEVFPRLEISKAFKDVTSIGANEKAYSLLEVRRKTEIEFNSTVYVGCGTNDHQALDLVKDSEGLAISFNGCEYAVRGSNVAVMSNNAIVLSVLANEFYSEGIQAVYDMIDNWDRESLMKNKCADRNLMDTFLRTFPKKLPVVKRVTRKNVSKIIKESEEYRKKVMACARF